MSWKNFYKNISPDILEQLLPASDWQVSLAKNIETCFPNSCLEAGCGYGVTSLILNKNIKKTLLDFESAPLRVANELFKRHEQNANFVKGDILRLSFADNSFDSVFNAGVLEHFQFIERQKALSEMVRVTKPGGNIFIAIPNHYSIPYRFSYEYRIKRNIWPYPTEEKIYDFTEELNGHGMVLNQKRITVDKKTSFIFLKRWQRMFFKFFQLLKNYEGYLTIIILAKKKI